MLYYLAYGSNLHPLRLEKRLGPIARVGNAKLTGWKLHFHKRGADGSGKGNLIQTPAAMAWGVVFQLEPGQKSILDEFEGDGYDCENMTVTVSRRNYDCFCYLAQPGWVDNDLLPHDWYRDLIFHGARHAQFDADYLHLIQQQPVQLDAQGRSRHSQLLKIMQ